MQTISRPEISNALEDAVQFSLSKRGDYLRHEVFPMTDPWIRACR